MRTIHFAAWSLVVTLVAGFAGSLSAQQTRESGAVPRWRARMGDGPSVGPPPSDYTGKVAPSKWCLEAEGPASGDLGGRGVNWTKVSRLWLRQVLSDTTSHGTIWRNILGGAPRLAPRDSIVQVKDEDTCREIAQIINHDVLGWGVGPPPVVVFRIHDFVVAYPSNARLGEWGYAVGMNLRREILGVSTW